MQIFPNKLLYNLVVNIFLICSFAYKTLLGTYDCRAKTFLLTHLAGTEISLLSLPGQPAQKPNTTYIHQKPVVKRD